MPQIEAKDELSSLRTEIVESQKARIDLLKYKLLAVAALGAFGLKGDNNLCLLQRIIDGNGILLCLIPFVCVFVDLLCYHNTLRILVIGRFLRNYQDPYEKFISAIGEYKKCGSKKADYYFVIEDWALQWSSVFLSIIIATLGCCLLIWGNNNRIGWIFISTGLLGFGSSIFFWKKYKKRKDVLFEAAKQERGICL